MRPDRREVLVAGAAAAFAVLASARVATAQDTTTPDPAQTTPAEATPAAPETVHPDVLPPPSPQYQTALQNILGDKQPIDERVTVDLPETAENGNIVPYKLAVESPMTPEDNIARLHLLSTQNPQALVAVFKFTEYSGKAAVTGRMRLAKTQDVVVIAETNTGAFLRGKCPVDVVIGGCGNE